MVWVHLLRMYIILCIKNSEMIILRTQYFMSLMFKSVQYFRRVSFEGVYTQFFGSIYFFMYIVWEYTVCMLCFDSMLSEGVYEGEVV